MSTDAFLSERMEKKESKKRKRDKESSHSHSGKRKRQQEEVEEDTVKIPATETPKKKHKRHEKDQEDSKTPTSQTKASDKKKKHKHKERNEEKTTTTLTTTASDDLLRTHSPFVTQTTSFYLALSPCAQNFPLEGLCAEHISPLLLTYYPPLQGVVLSYSNPRLSEHPTDAVKINSSEHATKALARSINEYAVSYIWLTADFILFRPRRGRWLEGYVSLQNESLLGLMCYNYFNAIIPREKLPEGWRWEGETDGQGGSPLKKKKRRNVNDESGYFVDGEGNQVEGRIVFRVDDFDATPGSDGAGGTVSISGTLRTDDDEI